MASNSRGEASAAASRQVNDSRGEASAAASTQVNENGDERRVAAQRGGDGDSVPVLNAEVFKEVSNELMIRSMTGGGGPRTSLERQVQELSEY